MENLQKELMSFKSFCNIYDISRTKLYTLIKKQEIKITKLNGRRFVTRIDAEIWLTKVRENSEKL